MCTIVYNHVSCTLLLPSGFLRNQTVFLLKETGIFYMNLLSRNRFYWLKLFILIVITVAGFFWSFFIGRYPLTVREVWDILCSVFADITKYWDDNMQKVVLTVRFPRIMAAILVGGALSVSGASYQTLFKNPMVSPDLLGVSADAGFGAALVMLRGGTWWEIQASAFLFGVGAVLAAYLIGQVFGNRSITVLVLAGVVVSSFFQALLSIIKTLADTEDALPSITFWLMGSLGKVDNDDIRLMLPLAIASLVLLFLFRHQIDTMAAGEAEAATMGVNVTLVKSVVVLCSTVMTVISVSVCGIIGWVGMVVPHIARALVGVSYGRLVSTSFFIGGIVLLLVDNLIRGMTAVNLPLGVLTSLLGTPIFVLLLAKSGKEWR